MANLLHSKGSRTQIYKTLPSNNVGNDGDIILSQIQGRGVFLCSKVNGKWHVSNKMEELRKIEKTSIKDLKTDRLTIGTTKITKNEYDVSSGNFTIDGAGDITIDAGSGNIYVKNNGGNYTPGSDYEIATKKYVDDEAGGSSSEYYIRTTCRMRCQYNNFYWGTSTSYGENYYYFNSATGSGTNLPTSYQDSYATSWLVPKNSTVKAFKFVGTSTFGGDDTWEIALLRGQASGFGSAGDWSLSQIGSTQSVSTTTGVVEKWEQTGLSVSVNENDMVLPVFRRTTDNDSSYKFLQGTYIITLE